MASCWERVGRRCWKIAVGVHETLVYGFCAFVDSFMTCMAPMDVMGAWKGGTEDTSGVAVVCSSFCIDSLTAPPCDTEIARGVADGYILESWPHVFHALSLLVLRGQSLRSRIVQKYGLQMNHQLDDVTIFRLHQT